MSMPTRTPPGKAGGQATAETVPARELPGLTREEIRRYSRHLVLPEVGVEGQRKLKAARVLVVGAGGLGSPVGLYLAAAGVGTLGLVDFDEVDEANLQRQILYGHGDVGRPKLEAALERLAGVNPSIRLVPHELRLDSSNALQVIGDYDLVVDGTDNFPTRYLINDACVLTGKPNVYGSIFRFEGQVSVFWGARGPCYRCLFAEPPPPGLVPSCAEGGVLGVLPGVIGALQASEAIKLVLGAGDTLVGRLLVFDALRARLREVRVEKNPDCPVCSQSPTLTELIDYEAFCGTAARTEQELDSDWEVTPRQLQRMLDEGREVELLDVRTPEEHAICRLVGARLIPLPELERRLDELDRTRELVAYCHEGARSAHAVALLREAGFARAKNLHGGIDAWSREIDPAMPRY